MFGVVPKPIWEKHFAADELNRIHFGLNSILIETPAYRILVETGIGTMIPEKFLKFYAVDRKQGLVQSLKDLGIKPDDIHYVINTHLHFDHCGGNTLRKAAGEIAPAFPMARYVIQKEEWRYGLEPKYRDRVSYFQDTFAPLSDHDRLQLAEGDEEVVPGVSVTRTPGHTAHHQGVKVQSGGQTLFFFGDAVPTSAHVGLSYIASYDLYPVRTLETKKRILNQAEEEDWICAFVHDPKHFFGKVAKDKNKFVFLPVSS